MSLVEVRRQEAAAIITYGNPPFGTLTAEGVRQMHAAVTAAASDSELRTIIITGSLPGIFIRHYDVTELSDMAEALARSDREPASGAEGPGYADLVDAIAAAPKPVIAAINGLCMGGGFELSLYCDLRIAADGVEAIGLPETRIGIYPGGGGTQRLPRIIGEARALEMILRGLTVESQKALELGLVHELSADPLSRAIELAREFAARAPEALAEAKRLTRAALDRPLSEGLRDERRTFVEVMKTASGRAGLQAGRTPALIQKL